MKCYYLSDPEVTGYRKTMFLNWNDNGGFEISEQRLSDQVRVIKRNKYFADEELDEIGEGVKENEYVVHEEESEIEVIEVFPLEKRTGLNQGRLRDVYENQHIRLNKI